MLRKILEPSPWKIYAAVSILVVMESAQEDHAGHQRYLCLLVSILVVMESAQEVPAGFALGIPAGSFNPCCNGKCSGSWLSTCLMLRKIPVSILVVMESAQEGAEIFLVSTCI